MIREETDETEAAPETKDAYEAFNIVWSKVQRHVRAERDSQRHMRTLRAHFDGALAREAREREADQRELLVTMAVKHAGETGGDPALTAIHLALRVCRTLSRREWEMVKAVVDLHKFVPEDVLAVLREMQSTHCPRCGAWLDDDDLHDDTCPVALEEDHDAVEAAAAESATADTASGDDDDDGEEDSDDDDTAQA